MPCIRTNRAAPTPSGCWQSSRVRHPSRPSAVKLPTLRIFLCPSNLLKLRSLCPFVIPKLFHKPVSEDMGQFPQGLKPGVYALRSGTAETVPCPKRIYETNSDH